MAAPKLTVVGGPNGAGKSSLLAALVADGYDIGTLVNPDVIAQSLQSASHPDIAAGRETLRLTRDLIAQSRDFTRETTLTGREILLTMQSAKEAGYDITLMFVGVDSLEITKARVRHRVETGGHDIPEDVQARRFERSFQNAARAAEIANRAYFFNNDARGHELVAEVENGSVIKANLERAAWVGRAIASLEVSERLEALEVPTAPDISLEAESDINASDERDIKC